VVEGGVLMFKAEIYIYIDDIVAATGETGHRNIVAVISKASHRNTVGIEFCNRCK
jgi:hypothetical protein